MEPGDLYAKLSPVTWFRESDMTQVELDIEVGVLDPVGTVNAARYLDQAGSEQGHAAQASFEAGDHILETYESAGCRGGVVDTHAAHMLRCISLLKVDESCV
jgi:hypothetical protein